MVMFALGMLAGIALVFGACLLLPRGKPSKGISVVLGNVTSDHSLVVTFRRKGGS